MPLNYRCEECGEIVPLPETRLGKVNKCTECKARLPERPMSSSNKGMVYVVVFGVVGLLTLGLVAFGITAWLVFNNSDENPPANQIANNQPNFPPPAQVVPEKQNAPWPVPQINFPKEERKIEFPKEERKIEFPFPQPPVMPIPVPIQEVPKPKVPPKPFRIPSLPARLPISPSTDTERTVVNLPEPTTRAIPAGDGRFLILHFSKLKKLGLLDVNAGKITRYIDLAEDKALITGCMNHAVVYLPNARVIQRYHLLTGQREALKELKLPGTVKQIAMGSASSGPIAVATDLGGKFLDLDKLSELELPDAPNPQPFRIVRPGQPETSKIVLPFYSEKLWVSPNGRVFHGAGDFSSGTVVLDGTSIQVLPSTIRQHWGFAQPSPDGKYLFSGGLGALTIEGKRTNSVVYSNEGNAFAGYFFTPAAHGPYYMHLHFGDGLKGYEPRFQKDPNNAVTIYAYGFDQPITRLLNLNFPAYNSLLNGPLSIPEAVQLIPRANLLSVINPERDKISLVPINLDEIMDEAGLERLMVVSQPPGTFTPGREWKYPVRIRSRSAKPKFKLESGPEGMTISAQGVLNWKPDLGLNLNEVSVILTINEESGKESIHSFRLLKSDVPEEYVPDPELEQRPPATVEEPKNLPARVDYRLPPVPPRLAVDPSNLAEPITIPLPEKFDRLYPAGGGKYLIAHSKQKQQAHVFNVLTRKVERSIDLADPQAALTASMSRLFVYQPNTQTIERFSLADGKSLGKTPLALGKSATLLMGSSSEGPLLVRSGKWSALLDADSLAPMKLPELPDNQKTQFPFSRGTSWVSADGRVWANLAMSQGNSTARVVQLAEQQVLIQTIDGNQTYVQPSANGQYLHSAGHSTQRFTRNAVQNVDRLMLPDSLRFFSTIPTVEEGYEVVPNFWNRVLIPGQIPTKGFSIRKVGETEILGNVAVPIFDETYPEKVDVPNSIHVFLKADVGVVASPGKDSLVVSPLNVANKLLEEKDPINWRLPKLVETPPLKPSVISEWLTITGPRLPSETQFGGSGRYFIDSPDFRQIRIYDLVENRLSATITTNSAKPVLAAGQTTLVVAEPDFQSRTVLKKYDIATGKIQLQAVLKNQVTLLKMGASSEGPLLAISDQGFQFIDLQTLAPMNVPKDFKWPKLEGSFNPVASSDGRTFFNRAVNRNSGSFVIQLQDHAIDINQADADKLAPGRRQGISADGKFLFAADGIFNPKLEPVEQKQATDPMTMGERFYPAMTGPWYVETHAKRPGISKANSFAGITIYQYGKAEPVGRIIKAFERLPNTSQLTSSTPFSHFAILPDAQLIVWTENLGRRIAVMPINFKNLPMDPIPEATKPLIPKIVPPKPKTDPPTVLAPPVEAATKPLRYPPLPERVPIKSHELKEPFTYTFEQPAKISGPRLNVIGGSGRFLLLRREPRIVDVFDLNELKVTHSIELSPMELSMVAGQSKLFAFDTKAKVIARYDLLTGKQEKVSGSFRTLFLHAIGSETNGPIIATDGLKLLMIDGETLEPMITPSIDNQSGPSDFFGKTIWPTPNGRSFTAVHSTLAGPFGPPGSPQFSTMYFTKSAEGFQKTAAQFPAMFAIPSTDGQTIFTSGFGPLDAKFQKLAGVDFSRQPGPFVPPVNVFLPATEGPFALRYHWTAAIPPGPGNERPMPLDQTPGFDIYGSNFSKPITTVKTFDPFAKDPSPMTNLARLPEIAVLVPRAKVFMLMNVEGDKIVIYPVDLEAEMARNGVETPWVTSTPPSVFVPGATLSYKLNVISKAGGLKFTLADKVDGMAISETGEFTWKVPIDQKTDQSVRVTVTDAKGNQSLHPFWLTKK